MYAVFGLTVSYSNMLCRQLQRDRINVPDQQKTDATLFIKKGGGQHAALPTYRCKTIRFRHRNAPIFSERGRPSCEAFLTSERRGHDRELGQQREKTGDTAMLQV